MSPLSSATSAANTSATMELMSSRLNPATDNCTSSSSSPPTAGSDGGTFTSAGIENAFPNASFTSSS
eukprot:scaffold262798_cov24-Attheya_sp.AAC.1